MNILTTRFGLLEVDSEDELLFEQGLIGLEDCRRWIVLRDASFPTLGWLQSVEHGYIALGVVNPRRFVPDYQLRVDAHDLSPLALGTHRDAEIVAIASRDEAGITLNLRGPLVINVENRRGCQVISKDDLPIRYPIVPLDQPLRRTA